jgi:hypothetical protein
MASNEDTQLQHLGTGNYLRHRCIVTVYKKRFPENIGRLHATAILAARLPNPT